MTCITCKQEKPLDQFRLEKRGHRRKRCNECRWLIRRCQNNGITLEQYQLVWESQGGVCAICAQPQVRKCRGKILPLYFDHDHSTGQFRGLLCAPCNTAIGLLEEDPERFHKALDYLRQHRE